MHTHNTFKRLVSPLVLLLALAVAGCNRAHNDNVQDNGPDQLPMRLQLPKDGSPEALRIVQYAQDNVTRKAQQSFLTKGPYSGGRELRVYDDDNKLAEIVILYQAQAGQKEQVAYVANFSDGFYKTEKSYSTDGSRVTEGQRLPDGTFEQSIYQDGGKLFKHAIFGRLINSDQKLVWKVFGDEIYRYGGTVGTVQQLMDDGNVYTEYYDEHHFLTEKLWVDKDGKPKTEIDFAKNGTTPVLRYDFADKIAYYYDDGGIVTLSRKWGYDDTSQELTYFKDGVPAFTQHWDVDTNKSDKTATPPKVVWYLSWVKQLRPDQSVSWQVNFWSTTGQVQMVDVPEKAPADAKYKTVLVPAAPGSETPAKSWTPPDPSASSAGASGAATTSTATPAAAAASPAVTGFFTPSGVHQTSSYSQQGYLTKVESYKAGQWTADKTVVHQESEHVRVRINPELTKALPPGVRPSDKPKDPTPTNNTVTDYGAMDF
jgi:hypothetical protein